MTKTELTELKTRLTEAHAAVQKARTHQRVIRAALKHPKVKGQPIEALISADLPNWRKRTRDTLAPVAVPVLQQAAAAQALQGRLTSKDMVLARARFTPEPKQAPRPEELPMEFRPPVAKQREDGSYHYTEPGALYDEFKFNMRRGRLRQTLCSLTWSTRKPGANGATRSPRHYPTSWRSTPQTRWRRATARCCIACGRKPSGDRAPARTRTTARRRAPVGRLNGR